MNHLAHFHLAAGNRDDLIGALLGDYVKGPLRGARPAAIERGIALHRRIDAITDSHPVVIDLLAQLPRELRRYGGIALDVCFDRCLSRDWSQWHSEPLQPFCSNVFRILDDAAEHLPAAAVTQYRRLRRYDTLVQLQHWETVTRVLASIGTRLRRDNPLHRAGAELAPLQPEIDRAFNVFYPRLQAQLNDEFDHRGNCN